MLKVQVKSSLKLHITVRQELQLLSDYGRNIFSELVKLGCEKFKNEKKRINIRFFFRCVLLTS